MNNVSKRHQMWLGGFLTETNWVKPNEVENFGKTSKTDVAGFPNNPPYIHKFVPFIHERDSVGRLIKVKVNLSNIPADYFISSI